MKESIDAIPPLYVFSMSEGLINICLEQMVPAKACEFLEFVRGGLHFINEELADQEQKFVLAISESSLINVVIRMSASRAKELLDFTIKEIRLAQASPMVRPAIIGLTFKENFVSVNVSDSDLVRAGRYLKYVKRMAYWKESKRNDG